MVADAVWEALGPVTNYIEPFAGSAAVLLARPQPFTGTETINDANGYVANFWRAVSQDPEAVARHADHPVLENDLHARHRWLWERRDQLRAQLEADPEWCDPKIAGWWVWGMSSFFTGSWCVDTPRRCKPMCNGHWQGQGVHGITCNVHQRMGELQARLRRVRVLCGDYKRAITPTMLHRTKVPTELTGVFLDPPYTHEGRDSRCYGDDDDPDVFDQVVDWAVANASPNTRIVMAGYDSRPMPEGWREVSWEGHGGHNRRGENQNKDRERLWLSPHCIQPAAVTSIDDLFGF